MVTLDNVEKIYANGTVALQNVNVTVEQNSFVSLVGPSGCGKSTLLRLVAGLGEVSRGRVTVLGRNRSGRDVAGEASGAVQDQAALGFVFQDANLLPWRSVADNVGLPLELAGRTSTRARRQTVYEVLHLVGLEGFAQAYPQELSGGMRMRVSIARALTTRPQLLLLDEPFGALDEITRQRLNDELLRVKAATGATVMFVTHNVFEAVYLSDTVVVMSAQPGRVVAQIAVGPHERTPDFRGSSAFSGAVLQVVQALEAGAEARAA